MKSYARTIAVASYVFSLIALIPTIGLSADTPATTPSAATAKKDKDDHFEIQKAIDEIENARKHVEGGRKAEAIKACDAALAHLKDKEGNPEIKKATDEVKNARKHVEEARKSEAIRACDAAIIKLKATAKK